MKNVLNWIRDAMVVSITLTSSAGLLQSCEDKERKTGEWIYARQGQSQIVEKQNGGLGGTIRYMDFNGDGIVDTKYLMALPRVGCFGYFPVEERDQQTFDRIVAEQRR